MKDQTATNSIPVVLLTARAQADDVSLGLDSGANAYIKKPFSPQELRETVEKILGP